MHSCPMEKLNDILMHRPLIRINLCLKFICPFMHVFYWQIGRLLLRDWQVIVKSQVTSSFSAFAGDTFS